MSINRGSGDSKKIDSLATNGLAGVSNSLAYRVHEIEKHFHNRERWFGKLGVQTATDWADDTLSPYQAISGNDDYGGDADDEAQVLGTADTPAITDMVKYDVHRLLIVAASSTTQYKLRIVYGSGTMADAITAGQYSEIMIKEDPALFGGSGQPIDVLMPRRTCGTDKVWIQAWNATNNATVDFFAGIHEYPG